MRRLTSIVVASRYSVLHLISRFVACCNGSHHRAVETDFIIVASAPSVEVLEQTTGPAQAAYCPCRPETRSVRKVCGTTARRVQASTAPARGRHRSAGSTTETAHTASKCSTVSLTCNADCCPFGSESSAVKRPKFQVPMYCCSRKEPGVSNAVQILVTDHLRT